MMKRQTLFLLACFVSMVGVAQDQDDLENAALAYLSGRAIGPEPGAPNFGADDSGKKAYVNGWTGSLAQVRAFVASPKFPGVWSNSEERVAWLRKLNPPPLDAPNGVETPVLIMPDVASNSPAWGFMAYKGALLPYGLDHESPRDSEAIAARKAAACTSNDLLRAQRRVTYDRLDKALEELDSAIEKLDSAKVRMTNCIDAIQGLHTNSLTSTANIKKYLATLRLAELDGFRGANDTRQAARDQVQSVRQTIKAIKDERDKEGE